MIYLRTYIRDFNLYHNVDIVHTLFSGISSSVFYIIIYKIHLPCCTNQITGVTIYTTCGRYRRHSGAQ